MKCYYLLTLSVIFMLPISVFAECEEIKGSRYKYSTDEGKSPRISWWVEFKHGGFFSWMRGDVFVSGTYKCKDGNILATSMTQKISGTFKNGRIVWDGFDYTLDGASRCEN